MARPARSRRRCIATTRRVGALQTRMAPPESSRRARPLRNLPHAQLRVAEAGCASPPPSGLAQAPDANHAINFSAHPPSLSVLAPQRAGRLRPHCVRRAVRLGRNARTLYSAFGACTARFKGPNGCQAARLAGEPDSFVKSAVAENGFAPPPDPPAAWRDVLRATQASRLVAGLLRAHACRNANGPACPAMTRMLYNEEMSTAKLFGRRITWAAIRPKCLRPFQVFRAISRTHCKARLPRDLPASRAAADPAYCRRPARPRAGQETSPEARSWTLRILLQFLWPQPRVLKTVFEGPGMPHPSPAIYADHLLIMCPK